MKIPAHKVEQAEALVGSADAEGAQGCWRGQARRLDVLLSMFSRAVLSVFMELHESRSVYLYIVLRIMAGRGGSKLPEQSWKI